MGASMVTELFNKVPSASSLRSRRRIGRIRRSIAPEIDKLRGAIQGDYDHGVFITTSRFTEGAEKASYKKGAISILLLDGDSVVELMLDRGIGVVKQPLFLYEVSEEFFDFDKRKE